MYNLEEIRLLMAQGAQWLIGRDQEATGSSLTGVTAFSTRKTHPYITERLMMGGKESNQTNKLTYG